jgi:hypothetical protein
MGFDVFMIRFDEPKADQHWDRLLAIAPDAVLIDGVRGIYSAHAACARRANSSHFFVIDADNWLLDGFLLTTDFRPRDDEVAVWRAENPVNGLVYGHGGIKLLPRGAFGSSGNDPYIDVATRLSRRYRIVPLVASEHRFNATPLLAWRTAFRECAKLASLPLHSRTADVAKQRLAIWCSVANGAQHSTWCLRGACEGRDFGARNVDNPEKLKLINDYMWLQELYSERHQGPAAER